MTDNSPDNTPDSTPRRKLSNVGEYCYTVLQIDKSIATEQDIKRSYRTLSLKFHPDRNLTNDERETQNNNIKFAEIANAYAVLSDQEQKSVYDKFGSVGIRVGQMLDGYHRVSSFVIWLIGLFNSLPEY